MLKAYKYRIYPNKAQEELLAKTFGCCRFVYIRHFSKNMQAIQSSRADTITINHTQQIIQTAIYQ